MSGEELDELLRAMKDEAAKIDRREEKRRAARAAFDYKWFRMDGKNAAKGRLYRQRRL